MSDEVTSPTNNSGDPISAANAPSAPVSADPSADLAAKVTQLESDLATIKTAFTGFVHAITNHFNIPQAFIAGYEIIGEVPAVEKDIDALAAWFVTDILHK